MASRVVFLLGVGACTLATACGGRASTEGEPSDTTTTTPTAGAAGTQASNEVRLGPYPFMGGRTGFATQPTYDLELGGDNYAIFTTTGGSGRFPGESVLSGLVHLSAASAIGAAWVCPGVDAVWGPVSRSECQKGHCSYFLSMPNPSLLACAGSTTGSLELAQTSVEYVFRANSTSSHLNGPEFTFASFVYPSSNPGRINYAGSSTLGLSRSFLKIIFDGTPVLPVDGTLSAGEMAWTLSNIAVVHTPTGAAGPVELSCASNGISAPLDGWADAPADEPQVSLAGMSDPVACPGTPLATPLTIWFNNVPNFD